jgi:hypothetical protein
MDFMQGRRKLAILLVSIFIIPSITGCFGKDDSEDDSDLEEIRINHLRMKGSHNSYHVKSPVLSWYQPVNYTHASMDIQADRLGVRQFELDVWYVPGVGLRVYHYVGDDYTNCKGFSGCLQVLLNWSTSNPEHAPIWIFIEPKDLPSAVEELDIIEMIQEELAATWPRNRTVTPEDVQGDAETLREGIVNNGWPTLKDSRGKVLFVMLDKTEIRDLYVERYPTLDGQWMFAIVDEAEPLASVISFINPETQQERLQNASSTGFMIRTRPDSDTIEAREGNYSRFELALSSGAHFITTDFPGNDREIDYSIWLPEGPVMCNPHTAPAHCTTRMIEPWGNYTPLPSM